MQLSYSLPVSKSVEETSSLIVEKIRASGLEFPKLLMLQVYKNGNVYSFKKKKESTEAWLIIRELTRK